VGDLEYMSLPNSDLSGVPNSLLRVLSATYHQYQATNYIHTRQTPTQSSKPSAIMAVAKKKKKVTPLPGQKIPPLETKTTKDRRLRVGEVVYAPYPGEKPLSESKYHITT
jgi:hypothetical protein